MNPLFKLNFQLRLHFGHTTGDFTICPVKYALVNDSRPKFNVSVNYPSELQNDLSLTSHVISHGEEADLLFLK